MGVILILIKRFLMNQSKSLIVTLVFVLGFSFSLGPASGALASGNKEDNDNSISKEDEKIIEDSLTLLEEAPDELLEEGKSKERLDWMIENAETEELKNELKTGKKALEERDSADSDSSAELQSVGSCAKGIASAIVQVSVPVTKLAKMKKIISKAGGAKKFASKIQKYYKKYSN